MKTRYVLLFRLSNKIVQVNFSNKTKLILSYKQILVTYVNMQGVVKEFHLDFGNVETTNRLRYTREFVLIHRWILMIDSLII